MSHWSVYNVARALREKTAILTTFEILDCCAMLTPCADQDHIWHARVYPYGVLFAPNFSLIATYSRLSGGGGSQKTYFEQISALRFPCFYGETWHSWVDHWCILMYQISPRSVHVALERFGFQLRSREQRSTTLQTFLYATISESFQYLNWQLNGINSTGQKHFGQKHLTPPAPAPWRRAKSEPDILGIMTAGP